MNETGSHDFICRFCGVQIWGPRATARCETGPDRLRLSDSSYRRRCYNAGYAAGHAEAAYAVRRTEMPLCETCRGLAYGFNAGPNGCAWCRVQMELADAEQRLDEAYAFLDDLLKSNPNIIGRSTLQDYARFNRVMMAKDDFDRLLAEGKKA